MAMMVSGVVLAAVVSLAWALATYNNEGEAAVKLATNGRFAAAYLGRDLRAARAMAVTAGGGLALWMGDIDDDDMMDASEFVVYYKPALSSELRRIAFEHNKAIGPSGLTTFNTIVQVQEAGLLLVTASTGDWHPQNDVVCRNVDAVTFSANRPMPQTLTVEYVLSLSRAQDVVDDSGRTIELNLYGSGTMRTPCEDNGFAPQH